MELARVAGLPVSWWDKAKSEGKDPPCWRELQLFADMILREHSASGNNQCCNCSKSML